MIAARKRLNRIERESLVPIRLSPSMDDVEFLANSLRRALDALDGISGAEPGSAGAYRKFATAVRDSKEALVDIDALATRGETGGG